MKPPGERGRASNNIRDESSLPRPDVTCPLACIPQHQRQTITTPCGMVTATVCDLCGQQASRSQWWRELAGEAT
jgi:hypothetical protein